MKTIIKLIENLDAVNKNSDQKALYIFMITYKINVANKAQRVCATDYS